MDERLLPTVWADESCSTGENLLDPAQRIYTTAAVLLPDDTAREMVESVRAALPASVGEPKFTTLVGSGAGRSALISILRSLPNGSTVIFVADKRFMIAAKMVDELIEPLLLSEFDHNVYTDGPAVALANLLHFTGPVLGDATAYDRMLSVFVAVARRRASAEVGDLFSAIDAFVATCDPELVAPFGLLAQTRSHAAALVRRVRSGTVSDGLDPAVPCLVEVCRAFGNRLGPFKLMHDRSNVLGRHAVELLRLDKLPDPADPTRRLPALQVAAFDFADSREWPQLQVADWLAGAARLWLSNRSQGGFAASLQPLVEPHCIGGIWPDPDAITTPRRP